MVPTIATCKFFSASPFRSESDFRKIFTHRCRMSVCLTNSLFGLLANDNNNITSINLVGWSWPFGCNWREHAMRFSQQYLSLEQNQFHVLACCCEKHTTDRPVTLTLANHVWNIASQNCGTQMIVNYVSKLLRWLLVVPTNLLWLVDWFQECDSNLVTPVAGRNASPTN